MAVKFVSEGYHTVTPLLSVKGAAKLIEFLEKAFGATEVYRFSSPDGTVMHAEMKIGDSVVMLGEAFEESPPTQISLYLYVSDADAAYKKAIEAGGQTIRAPEDMFWGDRAATVRDFAGNKWWIATHVEEVSADEMEKRARTVNGRLIPQASVNPQVENAACPRLTGRRRTENACPARRGMLPLKFRIGGCCMAATFNAIMEVSNA